MPPTKPLFEISPELAERLSKLSPEDLDKVLTVASKLLARRHQKIIEHARKMGRYPASG